VSGGRHSTLTQFCKWFIGQLNLASLPGVAKSSTSFGCGKAENVTSVGWQVTLCKKGEVFPLILVTKLSAQS